MFVTFEGGEGAGKTTLMRALGDALAAKGHSVVMTREPGGTLFGDQVRGWLLQKGGDISLHPKAELLLFLAARLQHLEEKILPSLAKGKIVLCDRFNDSTIAYQGAGRELGVDYVETVCDLVCREATPDLTFFLDIDPIQGLERTRRVPKEEASAGQLDKIEGEELAFHQRVRQAFHALALSHPHRIHLLHANRPQDVVFQEAFKILNIYLHDSI